MNPLRIIVVGALGRLGKSILQAIEENSEVTLVAVAVGEEPFAKGSTFSDHGIQGFSQTKVHAKLSEIKEKADVVIDASWAEAVGSHVKWVTQRKVPYVLAVTGFSEETEDRMAASSKVIPIVLSSNLSVGVTMLEEIACKVASALPNFAVEIVETHHRNKKDAPSGTAFSLANSICQSREDESEIAFGVPPKFPKNDREIMVHSLRGGDVVGEHTVTFFGDGERIELSHRAGSRKIFGQGAIAAAQFVVGCDPGVYTMRDVLGLVEEDQ